MKNSVFIIIFILLSNLSLFGQYVNEFTWEEYDSHYDIDQVANGPCYRIAITEAMNHWINLLYDSVIFCESAKRDMSEQYIYYNFQEQTFQILPWIRDHGIVNEKCIPSNYDDETGLQENVAVNLENPCDDLMAQSNLDKNPSKYAISNHVSYQMKIGGFERLTINNNSEFKKAILEYGPIIVGLGSYINHSILIMGWNSSGWRIKNSLQTWDDGSIHDIGKTYLNFNMSNLSSDATIEAITGTVDCFTGNCKLFNNITIKDNDHDGYSGYGWQWNDKPDGCTCLAPDANDSDVNIGPRGYYGQGTNLVSGTITLSNVLTSPAYYYTDGVIKLGNGFKVSAIDANTYFSAAYKPRGTDCHGSLLKSAKANNVVSDIKNQWDIINQIQLFPNPSNGIFKIGTFDNINFSYKVYNSMGILMLKKTNVTNDEFDLTGNPLGIYYIQIICNNNTEIKKIILR